MVWRQRLDFYVALLSTSANVFCKLREHTLALGLSDTKTIDSSFMISLLMGRIPASTPSFMVSFIADILLITFSSLYGWHGPWNENNYRNRSSISGEVVSGNFDNVALFTSDSEFFLANVSK